MGPSVELDESSVSQVLTRTQDEEGQGIGPLKDVGHLTSLVSRVE